MGSRVGIDVGTRGIGRDLGCCSAQGSKDSRAPGHKASLGSKDSR